MTLMSRRYPTLLRAELVPRLRTFRSAAFAALASAGFGIVGVVGCIVLSASGLACAPPTTSDEKRGLPADHTDRIQGVLHKPGALDPYHYGNWCADPRCHHVDLKGGYARADIEPGHGLEAAATPSCFQCHGKLWREEWPPFIRVLEPNAFAVWPQGRARRIEWWAPPAEAVSVSLYRDGAEIARLEEMGQADGVLPIDRVRTEWGVGASYQVRIEDSEGRVGMGRPFAICPPDQIPFVSYPEQTTIFAHGGEFETRWSCAAGVVVDIYLYRDADLIDTVRLGAGNTGGMRRPFPASWGTGEGYRVRVVDEEGNAAFSASFRIEE